MYSGEGADDSVAKFTSLVKAMDYWASMFTGPDEGVSWRRITYQ